MESESSSSKLTEEVRWIQVEVGRTSAVAALSFGAMDNRPGRFSQAFLETVKTATSMTVTPMVSNTW